MPSSWDTPFSLWFFFSLKYKIFHWNSPEATFTQGFAEHLLESTVSWFLLPLRIPNHTGSRNKSKRCGKWKPSLQVLLLPAGFSPGLFHSSTSALTVYSATFCVSRWCCAMETRAMCWSQGREGLRDTDQTFPTTGGRDTIEAQRRQLERNRVGKCLPHSGHGEERLGGKGWGATGQWQQTSIVFPFCVIITIKIVSQWLHKT